MNIEKRNYQTIPTNTILIYLKCILAKITKLKTTNGEEYELELSNVTGVGKLELVIPKDKIVDKAGNKNI